MISKFARLLSRLVHGFIDAKMQLKSILLCILFACFWFYFELSGGTSFLLTFCVYLATGGWKFVRIVIKTAPRDFRALFFLLRSKRIMRKYQKMNQTIPNIFQQTARKHPDKLALILVDEREWTFREVDEYSNRVANHLYDRGYRKGDVIALFMESKPEYVCLWLAMAKIGVIPALLNFNLRMESLVHCISISGAKALIYGTEFSSYIQEILSDIPPHTQLFSFGDGNGRITQATPLEANLQASSTLPPPKEHITKFNETLFYIYTSGTTGLPKAAIVIHSRFFYMSTATHHFFKMLDDDIIYDTLPLYHTAGGILGIGQMMVYGCTVIVRRKFSASRFWDDCVKYNATVAQYIGEICRYLLAQPSKPVDRQHRVRCVFGNGLRPQIWPQFTQRFGIERVGEFYGATEGNCNIINTDNTVGAVGFTSAMAPAAYPVALIKIDDVTGKPIRDRNGLCIRCKPGEPGEMVGKIIKGDPLREFDGYVNKEATNKKILNNIFSQGDSGFMTGDVLTMDEFGYMFFRDRTGDTFRWKGENVSTAEVEATISNIIKLNDATVYGVEIPGMEGRAGMAAICDPNDTINLKQLYASLQHSMPAYARPLFIRIVDQVDTTDYGTANGTNLTGTFKLKKTEYRKDGFNPGKVKDRCFYLDAKAGTYLPLDKQAYDNISSGKIRF